MIGLVNEMKEEGGLMDKHNIVMMEANRKILTTEKNFSIKECETLGLIYNITKFWHYLLGRKFMFHMDHYLVNKQALTG